MTTPSGGSLLQQLRNLQERYNNDISDLQQLHESSEESLRDTHDHQVEALNSQIAELEKQQSDSRKADHDQWEQQLLSLQDQFTDLKRQLSKQLILVT